MPRHGGDAYRGLRALMYLKSADPALVGLQGIEFPNQASCLSSWAHHEALPPVLSYNSQVSMWPQGMSPRLYHSPSCSPAPPLPIKAKPLTPPLLFALQFGKIFIKRRTGWLQAASAYNSTSHIPPRQGGGDRGGFKRVKCIFIYLFIQEILFVSGTTLVPETDLWTSSVSPEAHILVCGGGVGW